MLRDLKIATFLVFTAMTTLSMAQGKHSKKDKAPQSAVPTAYTCDLPAFVIYTEKGEMATYAQMVQDLSTADICLFGEQHNDPISHWLELNLMKSFYAIKKEALVTGAEMWEADNQIIMDEMMVNKFVDGSSYQEASVLWPNFTTDYKPLLQFAKNNNVPFVCTNIPRRYARIIFKKGIEYLDSLSAQAKTYFPPLPIHFDLTQPAYAKMGSVFQTDEEFEKSAATHTAKAGPMSGSKPSNLVKAQAIKDATMAHFILKNWSPGKFFYHFNGEFHSANHTSIVYYLNYYNPQVKVKTVSVVKQSNVLSLEEENKKADYCIVVPDDMNVTYISSPF